MTRLPPHLYFTKYFWKKWYVKNEEVLENILFEKKKFITRKGLISYVFWELTKTEKNKKGSTSKILSKKQKEIFFLLKTNYKPWWWRTVITLFIIAVGNSYGLFWVPETEKIQGLPFPKTARAALENNETYTALQTSLAAELAQPGDLSNLRILVKAAAQSQHPRLIEWRRKLANHAQSNLKEREDYLKLLLSLGTQGEAEQWFRSLPQVIQKEESIYLQCLILAQNEEEGIAQAFSLANDFLQKNPTATPLCEFFWDLCIRSQQVFFWEEGLSQTRQAAQMDGEHARGAIRRLLKMKIGTIDERKVWANKLWEYPSPTMEDAILCMNASFGENPDQWNQPGAVLQQDFRTYPT